MTFRELKNLSSEKISKMKYKEAYATLKEANRVAKEKRDQLIERVDENPDLPTPTVLREYSGKNRKEFENWKTYKFRMPTKPTLNKLRHKLDMIVGFLNAKTLDYDYWLDTLDKFANTILKTEKEQGKKTWSHRGEHGRFQSKENYLKGLVEPKLYEKMWDVFNKIDESKVGANLSSSQLETLIYNTMEITKGRKDVDEYVKDIEKILGEPDNTEKLLGGKVRELESQVSI